MQTLKPRAAAAMAVARPMPRLPPLMTATLSVKICPHKTDALYWKSHVSMATSAKIKIPNPSQIQHQPRRILQAFLDAHQKRHRVLAIDDAVIVGQRQIHHRAYLDLAADRDRAILNLVHAEDAGLRRVQDRGRHQRAVDSAIGDGEGAALHLLDLELALARAPAEIGDALFDLGNRLLVAIAHHRND